MAQDTVSIFHSKFHLSECKIQILLSAFYFAGSNGNRSQSDKIEEEPSSSESSRPKDTAPVTTIEVSTVKHRFSGEKTENSARAHAYLP